MTDRYRTLTALAVLLVAAIAATISYQHVMALALRYGQPVLAAHPPAGSPTSQVRTASQVRREVLAASNGHSAA